MHSSRCGKCKKKSCTCEPFKIIEPVNYVPQVDRYQEVLNQTRVLNDRFDELLLTSAQGEIVQARTDTSGSTKASLDARIDSDIARVDGVNATQNTNITNLTNRVTAVEGVNTTQNTNITGLTTRMTTAEGKITAIEGVNTTQNTNITNVTNRVTAVETVNGTQNTNITNLTNRVTAVETVNSAQATSINGLLLRGVSDMGTNANGYYIKYEDGTIIMYGTRYHASITTSAGGAISMLLPHAITSVIFMTTSITELNDASVRVLRTTYSADVNHLLMVTSNNNATLTNFGYGFLVLGRWK